MATTKWATSVEDSNDIDTTASSPHSPDGFDSTALKVGRSGGLCLWWKDDTTIQILYANNYVINTCIQEKLASTPIHISWFCGPPQNHQKISFWEQVGTSLSDLGLPWLCADDFNELLWAHEKRRWTGMRSWPPYPFSLEAFWLRNYGFLSVSNNLFHCSHLLSSWSKTISNNKTRIDRLFKVLKDNDHQPHVGTKRKVHLASTRKLEEVWRNE
ncbi:hypothetical protein EV1_000012 [Malus domestica]